jgi:hypothetical protein
LVAIGWLRAKSVDIGLTFPVLLILAGVTHCWFFFRSSQMYGGTTFGLGFAATAVAYLAILRLIFADKI